MTKKIESDAVVAESDFDKNRQIITEADFTGDYSSVVDKEQEIEIDFMNDYQISEPGLESYNR